MNTEELVLKIQEIIKEAGQIMLAAHLNRADIIAKSGHQNFVTEYDKKVQEFLEERLKQIHPDAHFYAEEDEEHDESVLTQGDVFIIDPIDGTSNFMKGLYPSCISIAMFREGRPFLGMIYVPQTQDLYCALQGQGAYRNGKPVMSSEDPLEFSLALFGTAPYYSQEIIDRAHKTAAFYQEKCIDIRRSGSAAYDLCMVASGAAGIYAEPLIQLWDYAAGALIAMEAGARVTDFEGRELKFRGASSVICAGRGVAKENYLPE